MGSVWGNTLKLSIFGESHGNAVGAVLDGFPAGVELNEEYIAVQMGRRMPGGRLSTQRKEADTPRILSGVFNGRTTGAPICAVIENTDTRSKDYGSLVDIPRPSHADYTGALRYGGYNDYRGGGHFSGRLTAPLVFAGTMCRLYLMTQEIAIGSHIRSICGAEDAPFDLPGIDEATLERLSGMSFPVLCADAEGKMTDAILRAKAEGDSLGGIIECAVTGVRPGLGSPIFENVESRLASVLFGVPGVKGVEFGTGFGLAGMKGSQANDAFVLSSDDVRTKSNHNGGILGGITTGMPIVFRVVVKPTPSIYQKQNTLNLKTGKQAELQIEGRHDPCIAVRAAAVIEAAAALAVADLVLEGAGYCGA